jgi:hypothetical protein
MPDAFTETLAADRTINLTACSTPSGDQHRRDLFARDGAFNCIYRLLWKRHNAGFLRWCAIITHGSRALVGITDKPDRRCSGPAPTTNA